MSNNNQPQIPAAVLEAAYSHETMQGSVEKVNPTADEHMTGILGRNCWLVGLDPEEEDSIWLVQIGNHWQLHNGMGDFIGGIYVRSQS